MQIVAEQLSQAAERWQQALATRRFGVEWVLTLVSVVALFSLAPPFLQFIQQRPGMSITDPVLRWLPVVDMSYWIFLLLYSCIAIIIIHISMYPWQFVRGVQLYVFMTLVRLTCVYLVPLEAPEGLIYLDDPFLNAAFYRGFVTKDLFFSGHAATMFLFALVAQNKGLRWFFYFNTMVLGIMILLQRFHYTADVVAAPFFVWGCFKLMEKMQQKLDDWFGVASGANSL